MFCLMNVDKYIYAFLQTHFDYKRSPDAASQPSS